MLNSLEGIETKFYSGLQGVSQSLQISPDFAHVPQILNVIQEKMKMSRYITLVERFLDYGDYFEVPKGYDTPAAAP